jgi:hypothetical protein
MLVEVDMVGIVAEHMLLLVQRVLLLHRKEVVVGMDNLGARNT